MDEFSIQNNYSREFNPVCKPANWHALQGVALTFSFLAAFLLMGCGGEKSVNIKGKRAKVCTITWNANKDIPMSVTGSVYRIYYSSSPTVKKTDPSFDLPSTATSLTINNDDGNPFTCQSYYAVAAVPADTINLAESPLSVVVGGL